MVFINIDRAYATNPDSVENDKGDDVGLLFHLQALRKMEYFLWIEESIRFGNTDVN